MANDKQPKPDVVTYGDHEIITPDTRKLRKLLRPAMPGNDDRSPAPRRRWPRSPVTSRHGCSTNAPGLTRPSQGQEQRPIQTNPPGVVLAAHDVKGDSGTLGYPEVAAAADSLCRLLEHTPDLAARCRRVGLSETRGAGRECVLSRSALTGVHGHGSRLLWSAARHIVAADQKTIDLAGAAGVAAPLVEDRRIGSGRGRENRRRRGQWAGIGQSDQPAGSGRAEEMCDVEFTFGRIAAEPRGELPRIGLGGGPRHQRICGRVRSQDYHRAAHPRFRHPVITRRLPRDKIGIRP